MWSKAIKKILLSTICIVILLVTWVLISNKDSKGMTIRQQMLRAFYPVLMKLQKGKQLTKPSNVIVPPISFYSLSAVLNNGDTLHFETLRGKKVLIVNTASDCGFTGQYKELQDLYAAERNDLVILGFPANDFKAQEKGTNADIADFCKINYGVEFPLMQKSTVIKALNQNKVFSWLSDAKQNGWCSKAPTWNFSKYLIDRSGNLTQYFDPSVAPSGSVFMEALR